MGPQYRRALHLGFTVAVPSTVVALIAAFTGARAVPWFALVLVCSSLAALRHDRDPRSRLQCAVGVGLFVPIVYLSASHSWAARVYEAPYYRHGGDYSAEFTPLLLSPFIALAGTLAFVAAVFIVGRGRRSRFEVLIWILAPAATILAAIATFAALVQSKRLPDPSGYVQSQPVIGSLHSGRDQWALVFRHGNGDARFVMPLESGARFVLDCPLGVCGEPNLTVASGPVISLSGYSQPHFSQPLQVRRDRRHGLWILQSTAEPRGVQIFRDDGSAAGDLFVADLRRGLSPPRAAAAVALIGTLLAFFLLVRARWREKVERAEPRGAYRSGPDALSEASPSIRPRTGECAHALAIAAASAAPLLAWYARVFT